MLNQVRNDYVSRLFRTFKEVRHAIQTQAVPLVVNGPDDMEVAESQPQRVSDLPAMRRRRKMKRAVENDVFPDHIGVDRIAGNNFTEIQGQDP